MSFFRGLISEALSLGAWIMAILVTLGYSNKLAAILPIDAVQSPLARASISGVVLFMGTLFIGGIVKLAIGRLFSGSGLRFFDRILGVAFGALRGVVIVSLLVLAANLSPELKREAWWQSSSLIPRFQTMARFIHKQLPASVGQHFDLNLNSPGTSS